jgi:hypothetical protein
MMSLKRKDYCCAESLSKAGSHLEEKLHFGMHY